MMFPHTITRYRLIGDTYDMLIVSNCQYINGSNSVRDNRGENDKNIVKVIIDKPVKGMIKTGDIIIFGKGSQISKRSELQEYSIVTNVIEMLVGSPLDNIVVEAR